ncbi:cytochrome b561 [Sphingomonas vulcanisoli]|uniref:Cytochrome b561 n=1 Tax=Sphingomonas vulcanisoli TaxID=1658060 RepID=A0ABX0TQS6_9SPHN|nr:cytochrome b [Sphingomonas vulcanisoli]NIJ07079.1 cytochrome b561 [Sphingomonas vulcanisoli]
MTVRILLAMLRPQHWRDENMAGRAIWEAGAPLSRYSQVAIILHWAIALLILFNLFTGLLHDSVPRAVFAFHVSSGITVLILSVVRIFWRLTHRPPPYPSDMPNWERGLAHLVHFCLYASMLLLPLSGWAMISANPPAGSPGAAYADSIKAPKPPAAAAALPDANKPAAPPSAKRRGPPMFWNLVKLPLIKPLQDIGRTPEGVAAQKEKHEQIETFHGLGGYVMLALLFLHIVGALKHQFIDRQREFARMGIGRPGRVG